jgi:uncharacterized protein (TIGR02594 family)
MGHGGYTLHPSAAHFSYAPWLEWAYHALGERRIPGAQHNPAIVDFLRVVGSGEAGDETAWCSAFANWCMVQAGISGSGKANARSWLQWGNYSLHKPVIGCVAVFWREVPTSWKGHVGFYVGETEGDVLLLGGNQSNASRVTISTYPKARLLGYRWPAGLPLPST